MGVAPAPQSGFASLETVAYPLPFPLRLAACPAAVRVVSAEGTTGAGRRMRYRRRKS